MEPDILCLQEIKATKEEAMSALGLLNDYKLFINSAKNRKGYSGTAILVKNDPISVTYDIGIEAHDQEGRVITAEFPSYYLLTVYVPNSGRGLTRLDYRKKWDEDLLAYIRSLNRKKPVIVCGDLNVAHQPVDLARPKPNYNKAAGYTQIEIDGFSNYLKADMIDTFRHVHPDEVAYSYWNYMFNARQNNVGWRIDYFVLSKKLIPSMLSAAILSEFEGSDHCPVGLELKI